MHIFKKTNIDFIGKRYIWYSISGMIILLGLISLFVRGLNYGIDFLGGTELVVHFAQPIDIGDVRKALDGIGLGDSEIKNFGAQNDVLVRTPQQGPGQSVSLQIQNALRSKFSNTNLTVIKEDKIEISQQVHFLTGKATILADSFPLLQQVVDVMVRNGVKRVRVEGHTDNRGDKAFNQKLSEDRAKSVADYLVGQGIDQSRIESAGYGDTKPVAPNLTARGRELNRRVEFLILEK